MHLVPTQDEVLQLLQETGALKTGHFEYPNGLHASSYLQTSLALRFHQNVRTLSVGLSRLLRANPEIRAIVPELSIVCPAGSGLPVAYGICEALRAHQVYWAESDEHSKRLHFRQFMVQQPGEKVLLVDDILRTGRKLGELKSLVESSGAEVVGLAVLVYQPAPDTPDFSPLPLYYLAKLESMYYKDPEAAAKAYPNQPVEKIWV